MLFGVLHIYIRYHSNQGIIIRTGGQRADYRRRMILLCNRRCIITITLSSLVGLILLTIISCSCVVLATTTTYAPGGRARQRALPSAFIKKKTTNDYATKSYIPSATSVSYEKLQEGILHNILLQKAIGNCIVQTRSAANNRRDRPQQQQQQQQSQSTRSRSDTLYNIRGGSSYTSGNDDYNDNGYNGGYRNDGVDDNYNKENDGYYGNSRNNENDDDRHNQEYAPSSSSSSRDNYYEEDYGRGSGGNGYYDDEGRYHDDYDDRGRGSSSVSKVVAILSIAHDASDSHQLIHHVILYL